MFSILFFQDRSLLVFLIRVGQEGFAHLLRVLLQNIENLEEGRQGGSIFLWPCMFLSEFFQLGQYIGPL